MTYKNTYIKLLAFILMSMTYSCSDTVVEPVNNNPLMDISYNQDFQYRLSYQPDFIKIKKAKQRNPDISEVELIERYEGLDYFLLEVKYEKDPQSENFDQLNQYLNFDLENDLRFTNNHNRKNPIFYHNEGGMDISGFDRILLAFEKNESNQDQVFRLQIPGRLLDPTILEITVSQELINNLKSQA